MNDFFKRMHLSPEAEEATGTDTSAPETDAAETIAAAEAGAETAPAPSSVRRIKLDGAEYDLDNPEHIVKIEKSHAKIRAEAQQALNKLRDMERAPRTDPADVARMTAREFAAELRKVNQETEQDYQERKYHENIMANLPPEHRQEYQRRLDFERMRREQAAYQPPPPPQQPASLDPWSPEGIAVSETLRDYYKAARENPTLATPDVRNLIMRTVLANRDEHGNFPSFNDALEIIRGGLIDNDYRERIKKEEEAKYQKQKQAANQARANQEGVVPGGGTAGAAPEVPEVNILDPKARKEAYRKALRD